MKRAPEWRSFSLVRLRLFSFQGFDDSRDGDIADGGDGPDDPGVLPVVCQEAPEEEVPEAVMVPETAAAPETEEAQEADPGKRRTTPRLSFFF